MTHAPMSPTPPAVGAATAETPPLPTPPLPTPPPGERARAEGAPRVAAVVAAVSWGLAVAALAMVLLARAPVDESLLFLLVDVTVAAVYGTVAAVVLARRRHVVAWVLAVASVGGGLAASGFGWETLDRTGAVPSVEWVARLQGTAWMPGTMALFLVVPWLVRDHPLRWAWLGVAAGVAVDAAYFVLVGLSSSADFIQPVTAAAMVVGGAAAGEALWRARRGPVAERNGLPWLALGAALLTVSWAPFLFPWDANPIPWWFTPVTHLVSQAVFPAAVLVAVLRGRMWDLGLVVSRAVLTGAMTGVLLVTYLAVVLVVSRLLPSDGVAQLVGAGVIAVAVQPLRLWLGRRVELLVYGAAADPARLVRRLGRGLGGDAEDLVAELVADLGSAMRLESVRLESDRLEPVAWGVATSTPYELPLVHRGTPLGRLLVTLPAGEALGARERSTLRDLSAVLATALAVGVAGREVAEARARLARARLEERRTIRREIHDGLGPSLAGLRLGLQGARNLLGTDPAAAVQLLDALQTELDQRVNDVRTLSHHLLPPVLDELGLGAALTELAARYAEDGLDVSVTTHGVDGLPDDVAAAAYGIVGEAVVNVARHSEAGRCWVEAVVTGEELLLTVADDGCGVPDGAPHGVGTHSMGERAEEQAGTFARGPRPGGGTLVTARIPVAGRRG